MITAELDQSGCFKILTASEPFDLDDLFDAGAASLEKEGAETAFGTAILIDFRTVRLVNFTSSDFLALIRKRLRLYKAKVSVPYAFIAGGDTDYGMLRMFASYADMEGLRPAEYTFVSCDFEEGRQWILANLDTSRERNVRS